MTTLVTLPLWIPLDADGVTQLQHPAELLRMLQERMFRRSGRMAYDDFTISPVASMLQITVGAGAACVLGTESASDQGAYWAYSTEDETIDVTSNSSGSDRVDSLVLRVADPQYGTVPGSAESYWDLVEGSGASARPDSDFASAGSQYVPGAWWRYADIVVPNSATEISSSDITTYGTTAVRANWSWIATSGDLPGDAIEGDMVWENDHGRMWVYDGTNWRVLSPQNNQAQINSGAVTSGTDTVTSSSYQNMAGTGSTTSLSFGKRASATKLKVSIDVGWQAVSANALAAVGVNINSTDYDVIKAVAPGSGAYGAWHSTAFISGLAAATYTVQARWKRTAGSGTPTRDGNTNLCMVVEEVD